jgi:hypothetical protein
VRKLVLVIMTLSFVVAGCAGGDDDNDSESAREDSPAATTAPRGATTTEGSRERVYARAELARLALQPNDAPPGMLYTKAESGAKTFEEVGLLLGPDLAEVRRLGLDAIYDVIFDAEQSDLRLTSRLWLFEKPGGARSWLAKTENDAASFQFQRVRAPRFGDGSWAARGNAAGSEVITHAFRSGNVVVVVSFSTQSRTPSESDALAATRKALARFRQN